MNVGSKRPDVWNNFRHAPSWQFYLHCRIEETGCPVIICIVCLQVLRHSTDNGTGSMGKHLLVKAHIERLNGLAVSEETELTSLSVDEIALAIPKRKQSRGIPIVSLHTKFKFNI
jgi:hypothetical protein